MTDQQRAFLNMSGKTEIWLTNKATLINPINPRVAALRALLSAKIVVLNANDIAATVDNTGIAESKNLEREEVIASIRLACSYLVIVCKNATPPNTVLMRQIDFGKSELSTQPDNDLLNTAKFILTTANTAPIAAAAVAAGYVAADLAAFSTNVSQFATWINKPREAIGETSAYTAEVAKNVNELRSIIQNLDDEMAIFEFRDNLLFNQYNNVRSIDDAPTGTKTFSGTLNGNENKRIVGITYDPNAQVMFKAPGPHAVTYSLKEDDGTDVAGSTPITIPSGVEIIHPFLHLAPGGGSIWVHNENATNPTEYSITLI
jgi:hypothetical protein